MKVFRLSFFRSPFVFGRQRLSLFACFAEKKTFIRLRKLQLENVYIIFYLCSCLVELCNWGKSQVVLNVLKNSQWRLHCVGLDSYLWVLSLSSPTIYRSTWEKHQDNVIFNFYLFASWRSFVFPFFGLLLSLGGSAHLPFLGLLKK